MFIYLKKNYCLLVFRKHFERVTSSSEAAAVASQRDAVLWVWRAHNEVNDRLAVIEKKYGHSSTGDAAYPKVGRDYCRIAAAAAAAGSQV